LTELRGSEDTLSEGQERIYRLEVAAGGGIGKIADDYLLRSHGSSSAILLDLHSNQHRLLDVSRMVLGFLGRPFGLPLRPRLG
jgi:hypothetical protein